ncbi:MAG: AAA family ATPase [Gemmatimonadota bacterium]
MGEKSSRTARHAVFLVGASGVGKTTIADVLQERAPWTGHTYHFDDIGVPSPEEMVAEHGSGETWQEWATHRWVERLAAAATPLQLLEGQTRPSFILRAIETHPDLASRIILLDCTPEVRSRRLTEGRNRPELADDRMDRWAVYLRGQADALGLPVIDTSDGDPKSLADEVEQVVGTEWVSGSAL